MPFIAQLTRSILRASVFARTLVLAGLIGGSSGWACAYADGSVLVPGAESMPVGLNNLTMDTERNVLGSISDTLFRITEASGQANLVYRFDDPVNAIHVMKDGTIVVATDEDYWDPDALCRVYVSEDHGRSFRLVKQIRGGSVLAWSIASTDSGVLYLGEYGPRDPQYSKFVHVTRDRGTTWRTAFTAKRTDKAHIHRVAVDPYTQDVWVTVGDGRSNRGAYRSVDDGESFQREYSSQATAIAFSPTHIFFGEDSRGKPRVSRISRISGFRRKHVELDRALNTAGSVYDMTIGAYGALYFSNMKYPGQKHQPGLWVMTDSKTRLLIRAPVGADGGGGFATVTGPDRHGYIYVPGFRIQDRAQSKP